MARPPLTSDSLVIRNSEILQSEVAGEVIALDIAQGECYGFNPVASSIWHRLSAETTPSRLCEELVGEFDVAPAECKREVLRLLGELAKAGLIDIRS